MWRTFSNLRRNISSITSDPLHPDDDSASDGDEDESEELDYGHTEVLAERVPHLNGNVSHYFLFRLIALCEI